MTLKYNGISLVVCPDCPVQHYEVDPDSRWRLPDGTQVHRVSLWVFREPPPRPADLGSPTPPGGRR